MNTCMNFYLLYTPLIVKKKKKNLLDINIFYLLYTPLIKKKKIAQYKYFLFALYTMPHGWGKGWHDFNHRFKSRF